MGKMLLVNTEQARSIDSITINKYDIPGLILMENAGMRLQTRLLTAATKSIPWCAARVITAATEALRHGIFCQEAPTCA